MPTARKVRALASIRPNNSQLGAPCRALTGHRFGWQAESPLRAATARLTICVVDSEKEAIATHGTTPMATFTVDLGKRSHAWIGNCVAIGPAAGCIEPLTHAPMVLLQRDIERLASLIPCSSDMTMECREYNRQHAEDFLHAELFQQALFIDQGLSTDSYWSASSNAPVHEKLKQKLSLFESHGQLVTYDLEPFNPEDWVIMHYGLGRTPARYDRVADRPPEQEVHQYLETIRSDIEKLVMSMPPHDDYMNGITRYLRQQNW
jgi:tryptophan halogenase